jgi:MFS family permease
VDRLRRVAVMVSADLARLVLAASLAVWHGNVAAVYALALGLSAGAVFFNPAAGSLLPTLVTEEQLVAANSGIWSAAVLIQVALAPVAGLLASTAGFGWAFAVKADSLAVSALLLRGLGTTEPRRPVSRASVWSQGRGGWGPRLRGPDAPHLHRAAGRGWRTGRVRLGTSVGNITFPTLIQTHVQPDLRGRVSAGFDLIWQAMRLTSLVLGGLLADALGIRAVFYAGGLLLVAAALTGAAAGRPGRG